MNEISIITKVFLIIISMSRARRDEFLADLNIRDITSLTSAAPPPVPAPPIAAAAPLGFVAIPRIGDAAIAAVNRAMNEIRARGHVVPPDDISAARYMNARSMAPIPPYNNFDSLRRNYLTIPEITRNYENQINDVRNARHPTWSFNWILNQQFYRGSVAVANEFGQNPQIRRFFREQIDGGNLFQQGVVEFMQFLEVKIQSWVFRAAESLHQQGAIGLESFEYMTTMLNRDRNLVNNNLRELFFHYYNGSRLSDFAVYRWNSDLKMIMDIVVEAIKQSFAANPDQSNFLRLLPRLELAAGGIGAPGGRWVHAIEGESSYLTLIFAITMIRFPTSNIERTNELVPFRFTFDIEYEVGPSMMRTLDCHQTNLQNQRLFYFIPNHKRVVGIWREYSIVRDTSDGGSYRFQWDYNVNLLRTCLVKIRVPLVVTNNRGQIAFSRLFADDANNIYRYIREQNPFNLPPNEDRLTRLYASLTIYTDQDESLIHIPWVREGIVNGTPYEISEFINQFIRVLNNTASGQSLGDRSARTNEFFLYFQFLRDPGFVRPPPAPVAAAAPAGDDDFQDENDVDPDDPTLEINIQLARRRRTAPRTREIASKNAPRKPASLEGMLVGAPYVGTKKEKHYLLGSLINRFTSSNALFQTPVTALNLCLLMSLMKAQMYCYEFNDQKECTSISHTGVANSSHRCENHFVQSMYSFADYEFPFLFRSDGQTFIRLFDARKYEDGNKWIAGCMNEKEEQCWAMAAEEILFHLEKHFERQIDHRNISDLGQAFSDFFNVCISIYDVEMRCNRVHMITPNHLTAKQLVEMNGLIKIVHLVFDQGHMHAITNLSSFVKKDARKENLRLYNYCPICDQKQCRELCKSYKNSLIHITTCLQSNNCFHIGFQDEEKQQAMTQYREVNYRWQKNAKGRMEPSYQCIQCGKEITQNGYLSHVCTIPLKKNEPLMDENIFVYDLECAQMVDELGLYKHECNCLYIYQVYGDNPNGEYFSDEVSFIDALTREERFINATFIAHNGGAYDIHFLLRVLERGEINHTYIPSPTSKHKFIQIHLTDQNIRFIDFMRFIPGSLRNIADAFAIPVGKGDFPHRFNNGQNDTYIGRIPVLESDEDYWGLDSCRSEKEKDQFIEWYNRQLLIYCDCDDECHCDKMKWNFQEEIKKYCLQDVVVLAEIVKKYRFECMNFETGDDAERASLVDWKAPRLDPLQFMTLPQITMQTLVQGFSSKPTPPYNFQGITTFHHKRRGGQCWEAILWLIRLQDLQPEIILHRGNCLKEYYHFESNTSLDGWCPQTNTAYLFLKCSYWGCPKCMLEYHEMNLIIPDRQLYASEVKESYEVMMHCLSPSFNRIETIWECDFNCQFMNPYLLKCCQLMKPEECFYGGRTEVFQLYANAEKLGDEIHYYDVTSLYPSVYAHHLLPVGSPKHLLGYLVDPNRFHPTASNRYFGFARIRITPKKSDLLGLLPQRCPETGRLSFPVLPMEGCWGTEEIYLAMQNGYHLDEVYEIYYWEEDQRSDQHLRGYVDYFLRMKQEAEGWKKLGASSDDPSDEEKQQIVHDLYIQNGNLGRIRPEKVSKNPVLRSLAKLYLNALWGKFAQKSSKGQHKTVYGTQQFLELWHDKTIVQESCMFREISQGVYKVSYNLKEEFINPVRHGNLFIAAKVTETARCVLHKQMIKVGPERVIYCDTDSIIFQYNPILGDLIGIGLGKWTNEYPTKKILQVYALAPKLYSLMVEAKKEVTEVFRAKGIQMTLENQKRMEFENVKQLIESILRDKDNIHTIPVKNFNIFTNSGNNALPYGQVYSRYNEKKVRAIITKRIFKVHDSICWDEIKQIRTYPLGFDIDSI